MIVIIRIGSGTSEIPATRAQPASAGADWVINLQTFSRRIEIGSRVDAVRDHMHAVLVGAS